MSNGALGKSVTVANTPNVVYAVPPAAQFATISINLTNMGTEDATIKLSIGTNAVATPGDFIEFGAVIPANGGILERTCMVCSPDEKVIVEANKANIAIRVYGLEQL